MAESRHDRMSDVFSHPKTLVMGALQWRRHSDEAEQSYHGQGAAWRNRSYHDLDAIMLCTSTAKELHEETGLTTTSMAKELHEETALTTTSMAKELHEETALTTTSMAKELHEETGLTTTSMAN